VPSCCTWSRSIALRAGAELLPLPLLLRLVDAAGGELVAVELLRRSRASCCPRCGGSWRRPALAVVVELAALDRAAGRRRAAPGRAAAGACTCASCWPVAGGRWPRRSRPSCCTWSSWPRSIALPAAAELPPLARHLVAPRPASSCCRGWRQNAELFPSEE
jgi:hypothetical protein